jgi:hypothetical protein
MEVNMSMLPDVLTSDECDLKHEDAFFNELHLIEENDSVLEESLISQASATEPVALLKGRWGRTVRVRGRNYSYPLQFDPLFSQGDYYAGCSIELY